MPVDVAINYGVSGPTLRGSGIAHDLRKEEPYSIYKKFDFDVPVGEGLMGTVGDCWDRYYVKVLEMKESIKKFFKNESLLTKTFPWTINLTNIFFLFLVFVPLIFVNDFLIGITLYFLVLGSWVICYIFFIRKKLLKKLND